jgi:surface carbohydrate biosynthesis protein
MTLRPRQLELSPRRWILSPIAIKARDLDGNALLAFAAAERGFGVLLGNAKLKSKPYTPRGFVIEKNLRPGKATQLVSESRASGQKIGAWCDEGLIYKDAETYHRLKFDRRAYELVDAYFTWGKNQAVDLVEQLGCSGDKIHVTGNPRFDVHRPDLRAVFAERTDKIRRRHGPYILVNTKFSTFNGFAQSEKDISGMRRRGMLQTAEHEAEAQGLKNFQGLVFEGFMHLVDRLSQSFPDYTVIVRPHPSEDHEPWRARAATLPNVEVIYDGNVAEWILASEICIHNNCTTGVEAYLLGKPAISYRPACDPKFDLFLPNALSSEAFELEQVMEMVTTVLGGKTISSDKDNSANAHTARHFIANIEGKWASESILDALDEEDLPEAPLSVPANWLSHIEAGVRRCFRPVTSIGRTPAAASKERFAKQKFDGMHRAELVDFLKSAQKTTGRFGNIQIAQLEDDVLCIY